eukprot:3189181-Prymnesium_polylepis.1
MGAAGGRERWTVTVDGCDGRGRWAVLRWARVRTCLGTAMRHHELSSGARAEPPGGFSPASAKAPLGSRSTRSCSDVATRRP